MHQSVTGNPHTMLYKLSHEKPTLWYLGILAVLDFHCRPRQIPARSWLLGVDTFTLKAAQYQTQQQMRILLASSWSIMPICDCHNQPTKPSVFRAECTFSSHHDCLSLHCIIHAEKKSLCYRNINFIKELNQDFHYIWSTQLGSN